MNHSGSKKARPYNAVQFWTQSVICSPDWVYQTQKAQSGKSPLMMEDAITSNIVVIIKFALGEVERLLREYTQNQEMVRNIGSHYYQIIYPVQLRQHKKMGISTREIGSSKVRKERSTRGQVDGGYQGRGRPAKTGKHFHRTSLLLKAFNHKFRLDLELNTTSFAIFLIKLRFLQATHRTEHHAETFSSQWSRTGFEAENPNFYELIQLDQSNIEQNLHDNARTVLLIHGWSENRTADWFEDLKNAFLSRTDVVYNVIHVDYNKVASELYPIAVKKSVAVGNQIGKFILAMLKAVSLSNIEICGHSLGGQIAGYAGQYVLRKTGYRLPRITALDPAGPLFEGIFNINRKHLDRNDAEVVFVIHSDRGKFGYSYACGTVDVFPNNGVAIQPGCPDFGQNDILFCSHHMSYRFYIQAVAQPQSLFAIQCKNYESFQKKDCEQSRIIDLGGEINPVDRGTCILYTKQEEEDIEHCYYHGTVQDYPGASAAFHTCNGVSGVIHLGNETFVIHPFYGGDLSKHPHVIFEARTNANKGCANSGNMEWRLNTHAGFLPTSSNMRIKRDVREATKYIETAIVIDKAMFEKRNGSTRTDVVHDSIQIANIADLYFRTLNTRVSVVYIETWQGGNQAQINRNEDIGRALTNFNDYTSRKLFKIDKDTTQLLTGEVFVGGEAGMAVPATVCTPKAVGISVDINTYEPHLLAGTMAHMIGHNIGMGHDDGRNECHCRDWHGCIMAQAIIGQHNIQPYKFSECSRSDYIDRLRTGNGICLLNKPNELEVRRTCGNRIVEDGEDCDCGTIDECPSVDPCCDPITCKLTTEAQCASGPCCDNCMLKQRGVVCREPSNECDLPEYCSGDSGECPVDVFKKNGHLCGYKGYCFNGVCPTLALQCQSIWGYGGTAADDQCFEKFNSKGSINGHCGSVGSNTFVKCAPENVKCGTLHCQKGKRQPLIGSGADQPPFSRTFITIQGTEYECKSIYRSSSGGSDDGESHRTVGLVLDGTPCGDNLICLNQTCTSIFPYIDQTKCPTNNPNLECSGHGFCTNLNKCYCELGWGGPDCSLQVEVAVLPMSTRAPDTTAIDLTKSMQKKETPYGMYAVLSKRFDQQQSGKKTYYNQAGVSSTPSIPRCRTSLSSLLVYKHRAHDGRFRNGVSFAGNNNSDNLETLTMVFILVGVVKGVFICFAVVAVCYRYIQSEIRGVMTEYSLRNVLYIGFREVTLYYPIYIYIPNVFALCVLYK
ncbi:hypothetical protein TcasGA2_TC034399 [Tribolium castaneum]|uniref:Uncharacterized protein n=1 Tax=Tribolium castaneum TaxID=7070 RepID=A0A139WBQ9_TRICA|nr:hypothetical protein TcasGA2_TC034399 [Tribolium castaneum]